MMWIMVLMDVWSCEAVVTQYGTCGVGSVRRSRNAGASACSSRGTGATTGSSRVGCSKVCNACMNNQKKFRTNRRLLQDSGTGRDRRTQNIEGQAVIGEGTLEAPTQSDAVVTQEYVCVGCK
jgi:hypothetical protein